MANPLPVQVSEQAVPVLVPPVAPPSPELKIVPPVSQPQTVAPALVDLVALFKTQARECWLCRKVAEDFAKGKEINEDDTWHFTTCVLSWAHLQGA